MPLHRHGERVAVELHGFDDPVISVPGGPQTRPEFIDRLMVMAGDDHGLTENGGSRLPGASLTFCGYGEIAGFGSHCNAFHMTGLRADGVELAQAIRVALAEAEVDPSTVDYVNAHGSGTRQNDRHETAAFKLGLGEHAYRVPVSSMIGHSLGAIGSLEIAASLLAMRHNVVPPTANLDTPDPECDLDYVPRVARVWRTDTVLTVGSGFGGFQSAMVLRQANGAAR